MIVKIKLLVLYLILSNHLFGAEDPAWVSSKKSEVRCECIAEKFKTVIHYKDQKIEWEGNLLNVISAFPTKHGEILFVRADEKRLDVVHVLLLQSKKIDDLSMQTLMTFKIPRHYSLPKGSLNIFRRFKTSLPVVIPPYDVSLDRFGLILPVMYEAPKGMENNDDFKIQIVMGKKLIDFTYKNWVSVNPSEINRDYFVKDIVILESKPRKVIWFKIDEEAQVSLE